VNQPHEFATRETEYPECDVRSKLEQSRLAPGQAKPHLGVPGRVERTSEMFRLALYSPLLSPFEGKSSEAAASRHAGAETLS